MKVDVNYIIYLVSDPFILLAAYIVVSIFYLLTANYKNPKTGNGALAQIRLTQLWVYVTSVFILWLLFFFIKSFWIMVLCEILGLVFAICLIYQTRYWRYCMTCGNPEIFIYFPSAGPIGGIGYRYTSEFKWNQFANYGCTCSKCGQPMTYPCWP